MSYVPMRELQQAVIALERMGTGLLRTGGALERIAAAMEAANKRSTSSDRASSTGTKGDSPVGGGAAVKPARLTDDGTTEAAP